ncbi:hypothetical protein R4K55_08930 [Brachyspira alvinipulli]|uniref:hypothetical protein n=1 Tax=Brachyspira alvinipulli TaxID=84379 RepID=UPI00260DFDBC|nr:hypothetical protein [uncultured Brachyspira sp.]
MNNIVEKVKQYFSTNFGKLAGIIIGLSFVITLILSILYKNRVDISIVKAIISAVITSGILFLIGMILKKYLGDVINESASASSNSDIDYGAIDDNTMAGYENPSDTILSNDASSNGDININTDPMSNTVPNIDKNQKVDYHSSADDIGSIVFGSSNTNTSPTSYSSSSSSMFPDKKVKDSEIIKEVHEDPEKVAKAVRTMIAKDEKENK